MEYKIETKEVQYIDGCELEDHLDDLWYIEYHEYSKNVLYFYVKDGINKGIYSKLILDTYYVPEHNDKTFLLVSIDDYHVTHEVLMFDNNKQNREVFED